MPLVACPECGGKLSTAAEMCPHCGHPNEIVTRPIAKAIPKEDQCYACDREATQCCPKCERLSCARHLVSHNGGRYGHRLLCTDCRKVEEKDVQRVQIVFAIFFVVLLSLFLLSVIGNAFYARRNRPASTNPPLPQIKFDHQSFPPVTKQPPRK